MKIKRMIGAMILALTITIGILPVSAEAKEAKVKSVSWVDSKSSRYEYVGTSITLKAVVKPANASQKVTYSSSNKKVATVSKSGVVKFKKTGKVKITCRSKKNKKKKCTVTIRVVKRPNTKIEYVMHRGYASKAPENTMAAFRLAADAKPWGIESDLKITKDGQFVLIHDDMLSRTHNVNRKVSDLTKEEIQALPIVNDANIKNYPNERVPALKDFLVLCKQRGIVPVLELKFQAEDLWTSSIRFTDGDSEVLKLSGMVNKEVKSEVNVPVIDGVSWNTKEDGSGETISEIPAVYPLSDVTYYAVHEEESEEPVEYETVVIDETIDYFDLLMDEVSSVMGNSPVVFHSFDVSKLQRAENTNNNRVNASYELIYNGSSVTQQVDFCRARNWRLAVQYGNLTATNVKYAKSKGVHLDAWTVYDNEKAYKMMTYGVQSITTDKKLW